MNLLQAYDDHCSNLGFKPDPFQIKTIEEIESLTANALNGNGKKGIYIWGSVGRGKTMLMDLLYEQLSITNKRRIHFHTLMREIRDLLAKETGPNPMERVTAQIAPPGSLLCLDELHISDVDNALVMEVFLSELLRNRLVIITTSNFSPDNLMPDAIGAIFSGTPGPLFLESRKQTLEMIRSKFEIVKLDGDDDYRLQNQIRKGLFLDVKTADVEFNKFFKNIDDREPSGNVVKIFDRKLRTVRNEERTIWCDYQEICEQLFSYRDYLELLADIDIFLISNVDVKGIDGAKRLGWLVEVIYDSGRTLAMSCLRPRKDIFKNLEIPEHLELEFERVLSRITELTR